MQEYTGSRNNIDCIKISTIERLNKMPAYTEKELLRLAKRINNTKRTYLLVDPLQAKHMPVSPSAALSMMRTLGDKTASLYPETRLVIGFAETATAISAAVAGCISDDCNYIHTTREDIAGVDDWIEFLEEHSHAAEQKLFSGHFSHLLASTQTVVFVDDELSTGKTLLNIIEKLKKEFPELAEKKLVAASVINRVSDENTAMMKEAGVESICLLKLEDEDHTKAVESINVHSADKVKAEYGTFPVCAEYPVPDARLGVCIGEYDRILSEISCDFINSNRINVYGKVLVIGTEEAMYPSVILAKHIEDLGIAESVKCHSTTRSPIGISGDEDYPIRSGSRIHSFYNDDRATFIYNIEEYDTAIIFTDAVSPRQKAVSDLVSLIKDKGCDNILFVKGAENVQHI